MKTIITSLLVLLCTCLPASAASNSTPVSHLDQITILATADLIKPPDCASITLTNLVLGTNGTPANDLILATSASEVINGSGGDDCIMGGGGDDTIIGGAGNDVCLGGPGFNTMTCEFLGL